MDNHFWEKQDSHCLLNPRLDKTLRDKLLDMTQQQNRPNTIWLKSSGTESQQKGHKLVGLNRQSILSAAQSVNDFLDINSKDIYLNPLPLFHIGGLAISARCFLAECAYFELKGWDVETFVKVCREKAITITSLVPTQIFDLIQQEKKCPPQLRIVLVGGGRLSPDLYYRARQKGWPLLLSYGMTETSAAMACSPTHSLQTQDYPRMAILPHVKLQSVGVKYEILSSALFDGFLWLNDNGGGEWQPRPVEFILDDCLQVDGQWLQVLGRESELVKILGETVNLSHLEGTIEAQIGHSCAVIPKEDQRRGYLLTLFIESSQEQSLQLEDINNKLLPYERITEIVRCNQFPRTELGKIIKNQLPVI